MAALAYAYYAFSTFYMASSRELKRLESISRAPVLTHVSETIDGLETIRALRSEWPDVRALACTGHATVDLGREYRQLGFDSWLAKPFTIRALHDAIAALID